MSNFTARTRARGEVSYYKAQWLDDYYGPGVYGVRFLDGPYKNEVLIETACAIASNERYKIKENEKGEI